jgi:DNA-binding cell septation regulator SpoVG
VSTNAYKQKLQIRKEKKMATPANKSIALPSAAPSKVEIFNFRALVRNSLRGFFSVRLPSGMIIHDFSFFEKEGKRWIAPPSRAYQGKEGRTVYTPIVEFVNRQVSDQFREYVLAAIDAMTPEVPPPPPIAPEPTQQEIF